MDAATIHCATTLDDILLWTAIDGGDGKFILLDSVVLPKSTHEYYQSPTPAVLDRLVTTEVAID
jgi:hypothetical protein